MSVAIRNQIDARLTSWLATLVSRQESYRAQKGRYFQGLPSHRTIPADGAEAPPDNLSARPTDQAESWADLGGLPPLSLTSFVVNVYDGARGQGWELILTVRLDGQLWRRVLQHGPETEREHSWQLLPG